jgi:hypothetical protein
MPRVLVVADGPTQEVVMNELVEADRAAVMGRRGRREGREASQARRRATATSEAGRRPLVPRDSLALRFQSVVDRQRLACTGAGPRGAYLLSPQTAGAHSVSAATSRAYGFLWS